MTTLTYETMKIVYFKEFSTLHVCYSSNQRIYLNIELYFIYKTEEIF